MSTSKINQKQQDVFWNYYRYEPNSGAVGDINYYTRGSKHFDCKTSVTGRLEDNNTEKKLKLLCH